MKKLVSIFILFFMLFSVSLLSDVQIEKQGDIYRFYIDTDINSPGEYRQTLSLLNSFKKYSKLFLSLIKSFISLTQTLPSDSSSYINLYTVVV